MARPSRLPRFAAASGEVGGKPRAREALARQLDRERKQARGGKIKGLRQEIRAAKEDRKTGIRAAAERCSLDRERQKSRVKRERAEISDKARREREINRTICSDRRERVRTTAAERIQAAKRQLDEEQRERRFSRTWSEPVMLGPRGSRGSAGGRRAAELRRESDDEVRRNLPDELHRVWDRHKRRFADEPHRSRTEAFEEWAAEHRALVDEEIARDLEQGLEDILATEQEAYEEDAYFRGEQPGGDSVGGDDWQAEGRAWLGKLGRHADPADLSRAYVALRGGDRRKFDQARRAVLRAVQRKVLGREVGAEQLSLLDRLPGGRADGASPSDFDPQQLARGIVVELEHTSDRALAREIAMDHLAEDPAYYSKLARVHREPGTTRAGAPGNTSSSMEALENARCSCGGALCAQRMKKGLRAFCDPVLAAETARHATVRRAKQASDEAIARGARLAWYNVGKYSPLAVRVLELANRMDQELPGVFLYPSLISDRLFGDARKPADDDQVRTAFAELRRAKKVRVQRPGKPGPRGREPIYVLARGAREK